MKKIYNNPFNKAEIKYSNILYGKCDETKIQGNTTPL